MQAFEDQLQHIQQQIEQLEHDAANDPELAMLAQEEIESLKTQQDSLQQALDAITKGQERSAKTVLVEHFPQCTIEIRQGTGGEEAKLWATDLERMYTRYAALKKWAIEQLEEGVLRVRGQDAFEALRFEGGVHRVQRVPNTEAQGRIHTSTATVAVLPVIPETKIQIRENDLDWQFTRAGGHGGQNGHEVSSGVRLTLRPSGLIVESRRERKQERNRELALELLRAKLWQIEEEKRERASGEHRLVIGRAMRSEKIRTYNYPQNRVTDHRIHQSWYALETILEGFLDPVIEALQDNSNWNSEITQSPDIED